MEALSGAASGIAVVSLTIQLIQSVALVREFIQDVKGASKELHRLVGKLELLNALLEDARKVLEQQSSLQEMHFPAPSMAIFKCLQDCEKSIQPLVDIVKKLNLPQSQSSSSTARLKSEIKLGLKTKEIMTLETRIQHDIDLLTSSLSINQSGILINLLPVLLQNQEKMLKSNNNPAVASLSCSDLDLTATTLDTVSSFALSSVRYSQQTTLVPSALRRLGLYRRRVIRYQDQRIGHSEGNVKSYKRDILWTADEVSAVWKFLGFGMTFTQQQPYGRIFPSLRTYPLIHLHEELDEVMYEGSVQQFQERIQSGSLHPFTKDYRGYCLLWYAAIHERPDVCRLLLNYGVKPELAPDNQSPLYAAMRGLFDPTSSVRRIDTYRCLMDDADLVDEFSRLDMYHLESRYQLWPDEAQWLWLKSSELLAGDDLRNNQQIIIRRFWGSITNTHIATIDKGSFPEISLNRDILSDIQYGRCKIFRELFYLCEESMFSYIAGDWVLAWLIDLDLDPELCVASEKAYIERSQLISPKRIVFERNREQKWILGFEWGFDHRAPGYSLLSEYTAIVVEQGYRPWNWSWPFEEYHVGIADKFESDVGRARFNHRMAAKERKERARLGQKQPRSRMPGAWKW